MKSIRYRTISFLLVSLFFINIVSGYYIYRDTQDEVEELFDAQQAQIARTIDQLITDTEISDRQTTSIIKVPNIVEQKDHNTLGHHYEKKIAYQIWDLQGNLLLMSENAPLHPLSATAPGYSRTEYGNESWYIFALYSNSTKNWIYTAQKSEVRDELIELITRDQLISMLAVSVLIILVVIIGVMLGTRPITILSREIASRDGNNLEVIAISMSKELLPIQRGVNRLLERIDATLKQEKSFNADLSHELRTPLASIKVHAQNIELKESLSDEGRLSITRMSRGIDNMSKTIEQLLLLNSIDANKRDLLQEEIGLYDLAKEVITLLPVDIHKKNDIELTGKNTFTVGNRALMSTLLRNLIENASKYSEKGSPIVVNTAETEKNAVIEVIDSGPGMTQEQKENSVTRHYRVSDTQNYGSGIGLSIVKKIVDLHSGSFAFVDKEDVAGLIARVYMEKINTTA
ncbi:sensor histidine kinase [Gilvimarinus polysaccharolyticus]|uniref:sensor histidine kinase n=1 Tax=Gilvimarinus polysaccharolyticus TaxID=863921 RepID=UPI0006736D39|nr:sensor histidine kinase [Gilvimarinus polysaccharolyticus]